MKWLNLIFLAFYLPLYSVEWSPGILLPVAQPIVKSVEQIMENRTKSRVINKCHPFAKPGELHLSFMAARYEDSGVVPPDAMGVVGPTQFILAANGRIRSFDKKTGCADQILDISTTEFFSPISLGGFTSDSRIRYDRFSDRWYVLILAASASPVRVLLGVSDSGIITRKTNWSLYYIIPRTDGAADYPTLGIDRHALYIGVNIMKDRQHYINSDAIVIPKSDLLSGKLRAYAFQNLVATINLIGPTTPQGVDNFDSDATEGYFIGLDGRGSRLMMRRVKDPGGRPSISENIPIDIGNLASPLNVPQKGSVISKKFFLQGFDKRLSSPHIREGHLYLAHNIGVDNTGKSENAIATRDGCKWYDIDLKDPTRPAIAQSGVLFQPSKNNDKEERYFWMPGIMTNGLNTLMICCSASGDKEYANAAYAMRFSNDPPGTLREPVIFTNSQTVYQLGFPPFDNLRWGEYSHSSVDPLDNMTFWNIAEYAFEQNSWGLQTAIVAAQPPAEIASIAPSVIKENQKNVSLQINGSRIGGSAFYDPGEGFPNRLKVEIEDVEVTSIKRVNAAQIDLIINTSIQGKKSIKITNPDGQISASKDLLQVEK